MSDLTDRLRATGFPECVGLADCRECIYLMDSGTTHFPAALAELLDRAKQAELALAKCERQKRGLASAADKGVQAAMRVLALGAEVERLTAELKQADMKADTAKSGWLGEVQRRELAEAEARKSDKRFRAERRLRQAADSALAQALRHPNSKLDHVADYLYRLEHLAGYEAEPGGKA